MASQNQLLLALLRAQPGAISTYIRDVRLTAGHTVGEEGVVSRTVIFPEGALLSSVVTMSDGRTVEVATLGQGDAVGVLSCLTSEPEVCRTVVRIGGPAKAIAAPVLKAAADQDEGIRRALLRTIRVAAIRAEHEHACSVLHDVTARLAKWLLLSCVRTGDSRLPLTQEDMAMVLGVQRTTLNASALHLKAEGCIRYSRGVLQVLDMARLERHACECYAHGVRGLEPDDLTGPRRVA